MLSATLSASPTNPSKLPAHWNPKSLNKLWLAGGKKAPNVLRPRMAELRAETACFSYASVTELTTTRLML